MSTFALVCIALAVAFVCSIVLIERYDRGYANKDGRAFAGWVGAWVFGLTLIGCGFVAVVVYPSRAVGRTTCRNWAHETGYPTKFRVLNWADTGTCLARTRGGRWVKNSHVIINVPDSGQK